MKRPERKPECNGCEELQPFDRLIDGDLGECAGCKHTMRFLLVGNGMYRPISHPPRKPAWSTGLPRPRGGERRLRR